MMLKQAIAHLQTKNNIECELHLSLECKTLSAIPANVHPVTLVQFAGILGPEPEASGEVSDEQRLRQPVAGLKRAANLLHQHRLLCHIHAVLNTDALRRVPRVGSYCPLCISHRHIKNR